ncbi:MAG: thiolase family protein [Dethiobacteria bacterium]|jgi:acetyl-CoA acyltransferase
MSNVYIIGVGMTRFGKFIESSVKELAAEAFENALKDAGVESKELEAAYVSNSFWGMFSEQHSIRGQVMLHPLGIKEIPIVNTENACAGASTALNLAYTAIKAGQFDLVLALGAEKISHTDKMLSFRSYASCLDVEEFPNKIGELMQQVEKMPLEIPEEAESSGGRSIFMDIYALGARWHMSRYGSTQRQMAVISSKNHEHGALNPYAQIRKKMSVEEILQDKTVAYPFTRAMCSPVGDGAAAAVICSERFINRLSKARAVKILASVLGTGRERPLEEDHIGKIVSQKAYEAASLGPEDIDLAELHDATAYGELLQTEVLGFCPEGEGGLLAESGATRLGGKIPVNVSGGLECRGHPIGASGLAMVYEVVTQLRGEAGPRQVEGARIGLTENGGGFLGTEEAAAAVHIFEKE